MAASEWSQWLLWATRLVSSPVVCMDSAEELSLRRTEFLRADTLICMHKYVVHTAEKSNSLAHGGHKDTRKTWLQGHSMLLCRKQHAHAATGAHAMKQVLFENELKIKDVFPRLA